jgi:phosphoribosylamine--glycine ligase
VKVLVIGGGGREHAIVRALRRSPQAPQVLCAPGNAGIARDADGLEGAEDPAAIKAAGVELVVIGPEAPLVAGFADACSDEGVLVFGPTAAAARLEGSKAHAKAVMAAAGVPTAGYAVVTGVDEALAGIDRYPAVIKADGLAAGKGVVIAQDEAQAREALSEMLVEKRFGDAPVVVEEFLEGPEVSLLALCDGESALPLSPARDYKRIGEGDAGPNTGGMGAYSPVEGAGPELIEQVRETILQPVVEELKRQGTPFHGVLYAGLMLTAEGPKVLEFNVRFGDPETQAVLPRLRSDLLDLMLRTTRSGGLEGAALSWDQRAAVTVVLASRGYPRSSSSGDVIKFGGVPRGIEVTHAGTAEREGAIVTAGGRVLNVTALGDDVRTARAAAYAAADVIDFDGKTLRRDIAA